MGQNNIDALASGTLIDAGFAAKNIEAVKEGVSNLERLISNSPDRSDLQYCLANGLSSQADLDNTEPPEWYLRTIALRQKAKNLFYNTALNDLTPPLISSQSLTNLGNSLLRAFRFIEAYDCYTKAIKYDPTNSIALIGAAKILIHFARSRPNESNALLAVASNYLKKAKENPNRIRELAGEQANQVLLELIDQEIPPGKLPDLSSASDYQKFVAEHRLALAPTIEGLDLSLSRWDSLRFRSITENINEEFGVPPIFAMFNALKADFLSARHLAFTALNSSLPETGKYFDTLDYANYGIQESILILAQRSCLDILDKIAVAVTEYLKIPGDTTKIYFSNRWFKKRSEGMPLEWQPQIHNAIIKGNTALIAISEVSMDINQGGYLKGMKTLRNSSTHRFTILHDLEGSSQRSNDSIIHYSYVEFVVRLIETLQLTRAVLLYFVDMINLGEHLKDEIKILKGHLTVPDHDWIRGEDV